MFQGQIIATSIAVILWGMTLASTVVQSVAAMIQTSQVQSAQQDHNAARIGDLERDLADLRKSPERIMALEVELREYRKATGDEFERQKGTNERVEKLLYLMLSAMVGQMWYSRRQQISLRASLQSANHGLSKVLLRLEQTDDIKQVIDHPLVIPE